MTESRRDFLKIVTGTGSALVLGVTLPLLPLGPCAAFGAATSTPADPLAFIHINADNSIELIAKHLEMGQGVLTGMATLVAEELGASWEQMRFSFAPADATRYKNLRMGVQATGGSQSMAECWEQMRLAGAAARQMLVSAAAADWQLPPSEIQVVDGVLHHDGSGRQALFGQYAAAAALLPVPVDIRLTPPERWRLIGKRGARRLEVRDKVNGAARFGLDVRRPGMVRAVIARPPRFGGRLAEFKAAAALKVPGVLEVFAVPTGVAVVASDSWSALQGRAALEIRWDDSAAERRSSAEILAAFRHTAPEAGITVASRGDVAESLSSSARVVSAEYTVPLLAHAPMEPLNVVVELGANGADLWGGFQIPTFDQAAAARALGLEPAQVRLHNMLAGGSFGRRTTSDYVTEACTVARAFKGRAPVQVFWSRTDDLHAGYYRPHFLHRLRAGLDARGRVTAWQQQVIGPSIVAGTPMEFLARNGVDRTSVDGAENFFYGVPDWHLSLVSPPNQIKLLAWRSVGHTHTGFAMECFIDELAAAAGVDPLAFRLGLLADRPELARLLQLAADKAGWGKPLPKGRGLGLAVREAFNTRVAQVAEVEIDATGQLKVLSIVCAVDCGIAINPDMIVAQVEGGVAWGLGPALQNAITLKEGLVEQSNFDSYQPLRIDQMPRVEVHILPSTAPPTGIGELGVPCVAPAVANAVYAASGRRIRDLPLNASG